MQVNHNQYRIRIRIKLEMSIKGEINFTGSQKLVRTVSV